MNIGSKIRELRNSLGHTQDDLAMLTGFSKSYIQKFEENKRDINTSQLVVLAKALRVPISEIIAVSDFRTKDFIFSNIEFREKPKLFDENDFKKSITLELYNKYHSYEKLETILNEKIVFKNPIITEPPVESIDCIESLAIKLRKKWKFGNNPIYDLIGFLEDLGIKIFEVDKEDNFVGFSCWMKKTPVIVVNTRNKDIPRRRFTILHELSHLLLKFEDDLSDKILERYCDQFAGAMLLPKSTLSNYLNSDNISLEELKRIKEKFGISIRAILVRMASTDLISWDKYHEWVDLYYSWINKDNKFLGQEKARRFNYLIARGLREGKITYPTASDLTGDSIKKLKNIYLDRQFS